MATDQRHSVSVAGVIVDDQGRALIVQRRDNGQWEPPGGILEHGETIEDGLCREVYEETGLKIKPCRLTGIYQNQPRHIIALVFRCRHLSGELCETEETTAFRWVTPNDVTHLMTDAYATRVLDAITKRELPAVRVHDGTNVL